MEVPRHWRLKKQRYALQGEICPHCENRIFPPREVCPYCGNQSQTTFTYGKNEAVYTLVPIAENISRA